MAQRSFHEPEEDEDDDVDGDDVVGAVPDVRERFFDRSQSPHWADRLRRDPFNDPKPTQKQGADEIRWGDVNVQQRNIPALGTVQSDFPPPQIIQATRPARVWSVTVGAVIQLGAQHLDATHVVFQAVFKVFANVGNASQVQYVTLDFNGTTNDFIALLGDNPVASKTLVNIPARQLIVQGFWQWRTDGTDTPYVVNVNMQATCAPVERG